MSISDVSSKPYRRGVGIILLAPDKRIFVGRRIDTPGAWQMPQGGIDKGETPRDAAMRELYEEVGTNKAEIIAETQGWLVYELPGDLHLQAWGGRYRGQEQKWFAMRFRGKDSDIRLDAHQPEFDAWKWATRAEVLRDIVEFKRPLYEAAFNELAAILDKA
jgi:putative (di)nucleoside polyphosphate hydrolase